MRSSLSQKKNRLGGKAFQSCQGGVTIHGLLGYYIPKNILSFLKQIFVQTFTKQGCFSLANCINTVFDQKSPFNALPKMYCVKVLFCVCNYCLLMCVSCLYKEEKQVMMEGLGLQPTVHVSI